MGIVNVTPDSFSYGGNFFDRAAAVAHARRLADEGADLLDVGGESTRPGSVGVSADEELRRVVGVVEGIASTTSVPISIDTTKAEVARRAIDAGAVIVNDVSGLTADSEMPGVCAKSDVGVICMHSQGSPKTMQNDPHYDNVVGEIRDYLLQRVESLEAAGIAAERIVVDPGIGFGKTASHNLEILSNISQLRDFGRPVLIGHSRKLFLGDLLSQPAEHRTFGTLGVAVALAMQSTDILRVHDVQATRDTLIAWNAIACRNESNTRSMNEKKGADG